STGGFSPWNDSVAHFGPAVQVIVIVFMILAGANFSLYYGVLRGRGWNLLRDWEFRLFIVIIAVASLLVTWNLVATDVVASPFRAGVDGLFQVASVVTTTGFATADFNLWPDRSRKILIILMFIGGCAGSTAGSMKVMRMAIGVKSAMREVRAIFSPNAILSVFVGKKAVPDGVVRSVLGFFVLYVSAWGLGSLLLGFGGHDLLTAATASAATIGNIGPGLARVGPTANYAFFGSPEKLLMVLLMWLGRLEIYAIAALFTRSFWRP
ncbi:MAG: potassium transporter TrkG, partial [Acidobacteriota bacterium]